METRVYGFTAEGFWGSVFRGSGFLGVAICD